MRLRSTPRAFWRVPRASPSGLALATVHTCTPGGGAVRRRTRTTARPACSLPWMSPTASTVRGASAAPVRTASIGRPCAECPAVTTAAVSAAASTLWHGTDMDSAIIVGAGTFGASLAWLMAREGIAVTLIDQFEPGDARASSGGESRLYRCAHGAEADYTRMARRAGALWRELEAATG